MFERIRPILTPRNVLIGVAVFIVFSVVYFNFGPARRLMEVSGGTMMLDNVAFNTPEQAANMIESYGDQGRSIYRQVLVIDVFYAIVSGAAYGLLLGLTFSRLFPTHGVWKVITGISLLLIPLDWLEDIGILTLLNRFPDLPIGPLTVTLTLTTIKFIIVNVLSLVAALSLFVLLVKIVEVKSRKARKNIEG